MEVVVLTKIGGILGPFAFIFGEVLNWLYKLVDFIGIQNGAVAIAIILFTIVTKMLMMPLTVKQQKYSKLSNRMQPELSEITAKYKGKKDEKSVRLQQMETSAVYEKYGTSPTAGCLPLLITLPIMFALYRVIYAIPAYVDDIGKLYNDIAVKMTSMPEYFSYMTKIGNEVGVAVSKFDEYTTGVIQPEHLIDIMTKFGSEQWNAIKILLPNMTETINEINSIHSIGSFNILNTPWSYRFSLALLIPVLAVATQLLQTFLTKNNTKNNNNNSDNPMAKSMNSMMFIMPFVSGYFCISFPICIGIYWVASTVVTIIQQFFINHHIDKMDLDEMIKKNIEKQSKRKKKSGINNGSKMAELAKAQTRSINRSTIASYANASSKDYSTERNVDKSDSKAVEKSSKTSGDAPAKKSISDYANIMKKNND